MVLRSAQITKPAGEPLSHCQKHHDKHVQDEARLRAELEVEFGRDAVAEAIARGKGLDPFDVAREVLAELETD